MFSYGSLCTENHRGVLSWGTFRTGGYGSLVSQPEVDSIWLLTKCDRGPGNILLHVIKNFSELFCQIGILFLDIEYTIGRPWIFDNVKELPHSHSSLLRHHELVIQDGVSIPIGGDCY